MKGNNDVYRQLQRHIDSSPIPYPESESGVEIKLLKYFSHPKKLKLL